MDSKHTLGPEPEGNAYSATRTTHVAPDTQNLKTGKQKMSKHIRKLPKKRAIALATAFTALAVGGVLVGQSKPASQTDEKKVPHYFGPNPNWALSPLRVPDVAVTIASPTTGTAATATATVDPQTGAITGFTVTNPGSGYTSAPTVTITSRHGTSAQATAVVDYTGVVSTASVTKGGAGYTAPTVTITGGGATTDATGTVYGGVDLVAIADGGANYTAPIVVFDLPDLTDGTQVTATGHVPMIANGDLIDGMDVNGAITAIVVDNPGSGYSKAPGVTIYNGTQADPIAGATSATAATTLAVKSIVLNNFGSGYTSAPTVTIVDSAGTGDLAQADATITTSGGSVIGVDITAGGSNYMTPGIKKFTDALPGLCNPAVAPGCPAPTAAEPNPKYIPLAVPEAKSYTDANGVAVEADEYVIGVVQYRTNFSSSLPDTLARGYVQIETPSFVAANPGVSQHYQLTNEMLDGTKVPVMLKDGFGIDQPVYAVTPPQWLGPTISATKNKPVRVVFRNLLPTGAKGDLFLPVDSGLMGSGTLPGAATDPLLAGTVLDEVRNPICTESPKDLTKCFADNRATLHLHGGISPWISDGTPHQWITPANENTPWPQGVSVKNVPDMVDTSANPAGCDGDSDGCMTFFYTNQQSARLMFYHDHSWGTTRLNVYAGEAAGYLISDDTEQSLVNNGLIPGAADTIPLIVQDRTFVPEDFALYNQKDAAGEISYGQDPTWDKARWGGYGNMWYHHVYMPAQNPGDPSGMSAYGRWMYGPWFWPPAQPANGPIPNPYFNKDPKGPDGIVGTTDDFGTSLPLDKPCNLDDQTTWQYQTDPFCEPEFIPGTPNISVGMEQFNDTPIVNGVAYPTVTLEPKTYRLRMLNAANDRFMNFQWYVADPTTASVGLNKLGDVIGGTEVALDPIKLAAAQLDPVVFPTPVQNVNTAGPDWIQIGTEGGFLPAPAVIDGQQPTTWITDPTRFDVGNVDKHSLLLAPAERADVIVDFSQFAGRTLILYNDAPAAFPARIPSYDYYTGAPDLSPNGAPGVVPGYGPNTRTVMQVKIADITPATQFDDPTKTNDRLGALQAAFQHNGTNTGVFEAGQPPIIVGQAAYNSAYGSAFSGASNCNVTGSTSQKCDGLVRINNTGTFGFNTLTGQVKNPTTGVVTYTKTTLPAEPKAIHDEMNSTTFDEFGRMQAFLGIEASTPGVQNVMLYPYINPQTEMIDATNLPKNVLTYTPDGNGNNVVTETKIQPLGTAPDGSQIWRITHNGVDTHPIHFHLFDVQILNRVTWDNIIIPPDANELGWKDTVRISPLEDTIVALRPIIPQLPFELPNSIRTLSPMLPEGPVAPMRDATNKVIGPFNNTDVKGNPTALIDNQYVNFGLEYVYHCHILSHEEMDMMRPVSVAMPPKQPSWTVDAANVVIPPVVAGSSVTLSWNDNSITDTSFLIQRLEVGVVNPFWTDVVTLPMSLDPALATTNLSSPQYVGARTYTDTTVQQGTTYQYKVVAQNTIGYGGAYPSLTAKSEIVTVNVDVPVAAPADPTLLSAAYIGGSSVRLTWTDNATDETGFVIERCEGVACQNFTQYATQAALNGTGSVSYTDAAVSPGISYSYRVKAEKATSPTTVIASNYSNVATVDVPATPPPLAPTNLSTSLLTGPPRIRLTFRDNATNPTNETGFVIERSIDGLTFTQVAAPGARNGTGTVTWTDSTVVLGGSYWYRIAAVNGAVKSAWLTSARIDFAVPAAPSNLVATNGRNDGARRRVVLNWTDNSSNENSFTVRWSMDPSFATVQGQVNLGANVTTRTQNSLVRNTSYYFQIRATNVLGSSAWVNATPFPITTAP
jgi:FtsP/CotA-like multicopper oxidase with cupredoxin domain